MRGLAAVRFAATLVVAAALATTGCASLVPRLAPPELRAVRVDVLQVAPPDLWLRVSLLLRNPNEVAVALDGLDLTLSLQGEAVSEARLERPVVLAAGVDSRVDVETRSDISKALAVAARALGSGRIALPYEISGVARLADGRQFPFTRRGTTGSPLGGSVQ